MKQPIFEVIRGAHISRAITRDPDARLRLDLPRDSLAEAEARAAMDSFDAVRVDGVQGLLVQREDSLNEDQPVTYVFVPHEDQSPL